MGYAYSDRLRDPPINCHDTSCLGCNFVFTDDPHVHVSLVIHGLFAATSYKRNAASPKTPAATAPKLATVAAAAPVKGVAGLEEGEVEVVVLLELELELELLLLKPLTGRKLAQVRRVVLVVWMTMDLPTRVALLAGEVET